MSRNAPQLTRTASTGNAIPVVSSAGFSQGDLIYAKNGDSGTIPNSALTSANFSVTTTSPIISGGSFPNTTLISSVNGSSSGNQAAKLTNGNIVIVSFKTGAASPNPNCPVFTIVDSTGATVVAETLISSTYTCAAVCGQIGAVALSGGGFAVYWINGAGGAQYFPCYAIYTNTGSVTTAAAQDTTLGAATGPTTITGTAIPSGGFALGYVLTSNSQVYLRAYGATGTGAYAWTTGGSVAYQPFGQIGLASRSDNSVIMVWQTTTQLFQYMLLNSSGGTIANATFTGTVSNIANLRSSDVTTLADGTTFVIAYNIVTTGGIYNCFRLLPTGNTLGSEFYIPLANLNITAFGSSQKGNYGVKVRSLAAGGFIFLFTDQSPSWNFAFFNSSGVCTSGTSGSTSTAAICYNIPFSTTSIQSIICPVELSGYINLYWSQGVTNQGMMFQQYVQISTTTYQLTCTSQSTTESIGSVSAAVNAYSKSASTPTGARFLASSTTSGAFSKTFSYGVSPSVIGSSTCGAISVATAPDASFVIAWAQSGAPYNVYLQSYSSAGALLQTITVGTRYSSSSYYSTKVTVLSSGKVVVAYTSDVNVATFAVYSGGSGNYSLSATTTLSAVQTAGTDYMFGIAGITNDRFVFCYSNTAVSQTGTYTVYDSSLNILVAPVNSINVANTYNVNCCAGPNGSFAITAYPNGSAQRTNWYKNTTGNTFVSVASISAGGATQSFGRQVVITPGNQIAVMANTTSSDFSVQVYDPQQNNIGAFQVTAGQINGGCNVGMTGTGNLVMVEIDASGSYLWGATAGVNGDTAANTNARFTLTGASSYASTGTAQVCTSPGIGNSIIIAWINSSQLPSFAIVYAFPSATNYSITSGVTSSAVTPISSGNTGLLNGYVLQGVAATSASAGGTGLVQTNGLATLNSSYSASTASGAFDYTKPNGTGIDGVKGTIVGRNVNLQGNT